MQVEYKFKDKIDLGIVLPVLSLFLIGLAAIYSSTANHPTANGNFSKQFIWGVASFLVFAVIYSIPTNTFKMAAIPAYVVSLGFLMLVLVIGRKISGAKAWLDLGPMGFQPSEFAKLGTMLALALYLSRNNTDIDSPKDIIIALGIGMIPVGLIMLQPDMGSAFVFGGMILTLLFWRGLSLFALYVVLSPGFIAIASLFGFYYFLGSVILVAAALFFFKKNIFLSLSILALNIAAGFFADSVYNALSPHQQKRIQSFIDPMADPLGAGYNAIQAQTAIGSGGFFGKGFLSGNQTQLQFIPEQWTDFIYCVIGEEFGFIGSFIVLLLFLYLFYRIFTIANNAKDDFLVLVLMGILSVYFIHFLINIGMVVGIMPVIGIPLPFVSYGGSSLMINMIMLGIVANIYRTRKDYV